MALFNTLRNKMGKIVIFVIGFSMVAFILTDLLSTNSTLFGGQSNEIGAMASSDVTYEEFQLEVDRLSYNYLVQTGSNPSGAQMDQVRQQAWQELIVQKVFGPQYAELGIEVTDDEMVEMVQGKNIHPQVRQSFTNPQTGQFDKERLTAFLQQMSSAPPQNQQAWINFEASLRPLRSLSKYENLIGLTNYANKYESKSNYVTNNSTASIEFLYVPFFAVADSTVPVTESELEKYLDDHADEYQREESKNIDYVVFDVQPSAKDSAVVQEEINALRDQLLTADDDSAFASINSEGFAPFNTYNASTLPQELNGIDEVGYVSEPIVTGSRYTIFKLSDKVAGEEYFVKASHILFKWSDETDEAKAEARRQGNQILRDIKNGTNFEEMARIHGTDGTASRGGDLGWFGENSSFVQEFKDASFNFRGTGLLPSLVETQFGYHIIKITEPKTNEMFKVAKIEKELFVSDETRNNIYRAADEFALESQNYDQFLQNAQTNGYNVLKGTRLGKNDQRLGGINEARNIIYWLFNKAEDGDISEIFEIEDQYVIAVQTSYQEKGVAQLDEVRNEITKKVRDQKKADQLIAQLGGYEGSLEEIKSQYGDQARINTADINLSTTSIPNVGLAPDAVGLAFALEAGELTAPFTVDNGVMILQLNDKTMAADLENYDAYQISVLNQRRSFKRREAPVIDQNIYNAAIEFAEIEDERYKFF